MGKYKVGDKFIIEIAEIFEGGAYDLHRVKGFDELGFTEFILDKLQKITPELKVEDIDDMLAEHDIKQEAYNKGLNDAWELANKIINKDWTFADARDCFGIDINFKSGADITREVFSIPYKEAKEAFAQIEAHEKEQNEICVGDVVHDEYGKNLCVTRVSEDRSVVECFGPGGMMHRYSYNCVTKTGKHLDIQSLLNQIGE